MGAMSHSTLLYGCTYMSSLVAELGADEHGCADGAAGVAADEGVHGEPGRPDCRRHPPHLLPHQRRFRAQGQLIQKLQLWTGSVF